MAWTDSSPNVSNQVPSDLIIIENNFSWIKQAFQAVCTGWSDTSTSSLAVDVFDGVTISELQQLSGVTVGGDTTGDIVTISDTQSLTNKTLTSPVINTGISGTAVLDVDSFSTASSTTIATSESIKAYVDKPASCFLIRMLGNTTNVAVGSSVDVPFDTVVFDKGSDFDTGTYTFTAPVTGVYHFDVSVYLDNVDTASTYIKITLATSSGSYEKIMYPGNDLTADSATTMGFSILVSLSASSTAKVTYYQSGGAQQTDLLTGFYSSWFSGHLVYVN